MSDRPHRFLATDGHGTNLSLRFTNASDGLCVRIGDDFGGDLTSMSIIITRQEVMKMIEFLREGLRGDAL